MFLTSARSGGSCVGSSGDKSRQLPWTAPASRMLPAVTTKPTTVRMLVCYGGVSLGVSWISCLPVNRESFILDLRGFLSPPSPSFLSPRPALSEQALCHEILCLRTMTSAKVTRTVSVQLMKVSFALLTPQ